MNEWHNTNSINYTDRRLLTNIQIFKIHYENTSGIYVEALLISTIDMWIKIMNNMIQNASSIPKKITLLSRCLEETQNCSEQTLKESDIFTFLPSTRTLCLSKIWYLTFYSVLMSTGNNFSQKSFWTLVQHQYSFTYFTFLYPLYTVRCKFRIFTMINDSAYWSISPPFITSSKT